MPRKMLVQTADGRKHLLQEAGADNESQLQELMKANPALLPIEEFEMTGPLMVIGRETTLPSGAADLVGLARSGELLIVEFKTGPQNTDFRRVLAQLLDYGSDIWRMTYGEFERTVPLRYFTSTACAEPGVRGKTSLEDAARVVWPDLSEDEWNHIQEHVEQQLARGSFHYVLVAQRFTATVERSITYMNAAMSAARFYAVELIRFAGGELSAFESRTILKPAPLVGPQAGESIINEDRLLDQVPDSTYRGTLRDLLEKLRGFQYLFEWGKRGVSIRVRTPDRTEPLSIAWLFPPETIGWYGLTDLTLGYDRGSAKNHPSAQPALERYIEEVGALEGAERVKSPTLPGYRFSPERTKQHMPTITEILAQFPQWIDGGAPG